MAITVIKSQCVLTSRTVYALYRDDFPIVPATVYLRFLANEIELKPNTLASRTYSLKIFFEFLETANLSFWEITPVTIKQFKRFQLGRNGNGPQLQPLKRKSALQYLKAVKGLIQYWRGPITNDPLFLDEVAQLDGRVIRKRGRGVLSHLSWTMPIPHDLWQIRIPMDERHDKRRYKGLSKQQCQDVMKALNGRVPGDGVGRLLFYRDRAIWAFLLMTGLRKAELCRIRVEDIDPCTGFVRLVNRPEDEKHGGLKSGPAEIFVSAENPLWRFIDSWLLEGRWVAEDLLNQKGMTDHGMLFTNRNGSALTRSSVDHLFVRLRMECGFAQTPFHPHMTRHTIATSMLEMGVDLVEIQRFLRHRCSSSTEAYARVSDWVYREAMVSFWQTFQGF